MTQEKLLSENKKYLAYLKVASFRRGFSNTEKGKKSAAGLTLHLFEKEDGIIFSARQRCDGNFGDYFKYKLRIFKTKKGETRFRFYDITQRIGRPVARTCSPCKMQSKLIGVIAQIETQKSKNINTKAIKDGLYLTQQKRLISFLRKFLLRHHVEISGYSKNPLNMLTQLCYPGTKCFSDDVISGKISCGAFFLDDPVKLALRSKGRLSKKLVYQAIAECPEGAQSLLRFAKYIRITRSLDHAQRFLSYYIEAAAVLGLERINLHDRTIRPAANFTLTAKILKMFDCFSEEQLFRAFVTHRRLFIDSLLMIQRLNANDGFRLDMSQIRTIDQLHDALIEASPGRRRSKQFAHYEFDKSLRSIKFCSLLASSFNDGVHSIEYAKSTEELDIQARKMHNCAFGYHSAIKSGNYAIFCIKKNKSLSYMFGVRFSSGQAHLDQAVAHCNQSIDPAILNELNEKIATAAASDYEYVFNPVKLID